MHFCKEFNVSTIFEALIFFIIEMKMSVFSEVLFFYSWLLANLNQESEFYDTKNYSIINRTCVFMTVFFLFFFEVLRMKAQKMFWVGTLFVLQIKLWFSFSLCLVGCLFAFFQLVITNFD